MIEKSLFEEKLNSTRVAYLGTFLGLQIELLDPNQASRTPARKTGVLSLNVEVEPAVKC